MTPLSPISKSYLGLGLQGGGFHRIHYTEWGNRADSRVLICVHGLTRNGRDFDALAAALGDARRVLCPDVVGRGQSGWLSAPDAYGYPQYTVDMAALIARSGAAQVDWVGTSMGGLIGMLLAAQPNSPIRRLVLNDVGARITKASLQRIGEYVVRSETFPTPEALARRLREIAAPFGPLSDEQWRHLAEHSTRRLDSGDYAFAYDPAIGAAFAGDPEDVDLWPVWEQVQCPVLLLRGAESDLLLAEDAEAMVRSKPGTRLIEFDGVGHAPALMAGEQIAAVRNWLLA